MDAVNQEEKPDAEKKPDELHDFALFLMDELRRILRESADVKVVRRATAEMEPLLTIEMLAEYIHRPLEGVRKMRVEGSLPAADQIGKRLYWKMCDVEDWVEAQRESDDGHAVFPRSRRDAS